MEFDRQPSRAVSHESYISLEKGFSFGYNKQRAKYFLLQHAQRCFIDMLQIKRTNEKYFINDMLFSCVIQRIVYIQMQFSRKTI